MSRFCDADPVAHEVGTIAIPIAPLVQAVEHVLDEAQLVQVLLRLHIRRIDHPDSRMVALHSAGDRRVEAGSLVKVRLAVTAEDQHRADAQPTVY